MRWFLIFCLAGCSDLPSALAEPQVTGAGERAGDDRAPCPPERCGDPDARSILYPGDPACDGGCERALAGAEIYVPPRNGRPWGDTYRLGTDEPLVIAGYSSGRIALLRRLALVGDGRHAVMLDPLWPDGERDFLGRGPERGEAIVRDWLAADPRRTFLLIHSRQSGGWSGYAALRDTEVGARVTVCAVDEPHLRVPAVEGIRGALVDPERWDNGACERGG
jgi:hypothetical protein